ncbi:MAG: hypothetical protein JSS83_28375 [Cyanobacteria bacterium SZAS LIN-3]|nr:hypothetical protein [Cyanobacteria bacterium SZAS LIN-3]
MKSFVINAILSAIAIILIVPHISGAYFHGNIVTGLAMGAALAAVAWILGKIAEVFTVVTVGLGGCLIAIFLLFFFWLIPAIELRIVAHYFPQYLGFSGWGPAILSGLAFMVISFIARKFGIK